MVKTLGVRANRHVNMLIHYFYIQEPCAYIGFGEVLAAVQFCAHCNVQMQIMLQQLNIVQKTEEDLAAYSENKQLHGHGLLCGGVFQQLVKTMHL